MAAGGAPWEVEALRAVGDGSSGAVLVKRCVDLRDLLATSATGQARVAVVSAALAGLDADSVGHLREAGTGVVLVADGGAVAVADLPGVFEVLAEAQVGDLAVVVAAAAQAAREVDAGAAAPSSSPDLSDTDSPAAGGTADSRGVEGRVLAVWGPTGAPGRTTVAVGVAAELAHRGHDVLLVDADAYGAAVGQHLGVLDEVSGLLSAVRLANAGRLDVGGLAPLARTVPPGLRVLTGLPRPDRWPEVRGVAFDAVVDVARALCPYVVLDLGFSLEETEQAFGSSAPQRNLMTSAGLALADEILVVGSADPVGLARLARALVELPEVVPSALTRVLVNRMRPSLGWGEQEVRAMVEGFVTPLSLHFLPHDHIAADRALLAGQPLVEGGDSALRRALGRLVDCVEGRDAGAGRGTAARRGGGPFRRRRAGRAR